MKEVFWASSVTSSADPSGFLFLFGFKNKILMRKIEFEKSEFFMRKFCFIYLASVHLLFCVPQLIRVSLRLRLRVHKGIEWNGIE